MLESNKTVAADLGYCNTKVTDGLDTWNDYSVLGEPKQLFDPYGPEDMRYEDDKSIFFVGSLAQRKSEVIHAGTAENKAEAWMTKILLRCGLGWVAPYGSVNLVSGLPVDYYFKQKDSFIKLLEEFNSDDPYTLYKGYMQREAKPFILKQYITAQPNGSIMNYLLTDSGDIADKDEARKEILAVDIGFYTLDLFGVKAMMPEERWSSTPEGLGVDKAYKLIQENLKERFGKAPSRYDLDWISHTGYEYNGYDIEPLYTKAFMTLGSQISNQVEQLNHNFHKYIITGGRASDIAPYIRVPDEKKEIMGQLGNVTGYLKIGRRLWR